MARKERDPRDIDVHELVDVIENLLMTCRNYDIIPKGKHDAERLIAKLVGPERESESRWSSRHIVVDEAYTEKLADSLGISKEEAYNFFIGEPVRGVEKVASWALEQADKHFAGLDKDYEIDEDARLYAARGRMVADMLRQWAITQQRGTFRLAQDRPQATPLEEVS